MTAPITGQSTPENRSALSLAAIEVHEKLCENLNELKFCSASIDIMRCLSTKKGQDAIAYDPISDDTFYELLYKIENTLQVVSKSLLETMETLRAAGNHKDHEA